MCGAAVGVGKSALPARGSAGLPSARCPSSGHSLAFCARGFAMIRQGDLMGWLVLLFFGCGVRAGSLKAEHRIFHNVLLCNYFNRKCPIIGGAGIATLEPLATP